nr:hypothetical protein [Phaeobacter sp. J2-8]
MPGSGCDVIVKIVTLFLIGMGVLAMFGKLRLPNVRKLGGKYLGSDKCRSCGRYRIGKGKCPCGGNKGKRG